MASSSTKFSAFVALAALFAGLNLMQDNGDEATLDTALSPDEAAAEQSLGGKVHIAFCTSWSYRGGFQQVKHSLEVQFPGIDVVGSNFPPPSPKYQIAQVIQAGMLGTIGGTIFGERMFEMSGVTPPGFFNSMKNNKMSTCLGAWFVGNTVVQNLVSTGAFEVYYDGQVVFSKLATGKLPVLNSVVRDVGIAIAARENQSKHVLKGKYQAPTIEELERDVF